MRSLEVTSDVEQAIRRKEAIEPVEWEFKVHRFPLADYHPNVASVLIKSGVN